MKRGGPIPRRTPLSAQSKNPDRRRRARAKRREQMGEDSGIAQFIRKLPCVACARDYQSAQALRIAREWIEDGGGWTESIVAHLRTRGAGHGPTTRDDGKPNLIPLCARHHGEQEAATDRFAKAHGFDPWRVAWLIACEFQRIAGR